VVWASGELSALVVTGQRTGTTCSEMGVVLIRLFRAPGDPAAAWPKGARRLIPGPFVFYPVVAVLAVAAAAAAFAIYRVFSGLNFSGSAGSRWATGRDLGPLKVKGPVAGRLVLGRVGSKLIAAEARQSVIVLGPTQSMKTTGFAIPAILEWAGPVVATSVKTDLLRHTIAARRRAGKVWVYDPTGCTGEASHTWSPLALCGDWHGAQRTASWLTGATRTEGSGISDAEFWYQAAAKLLAPLLFAAATSKRSIADVVRWVNTQERKEITEALEAAGVQAALDAAKASFKREGRHKSSVYTTAETVLAAYEDPVVADSAQDCNINADALLEGGAHTLYVVAPSHEQRRLRPLFETLLHTVIARAFERSSQESDVHKPGLLVVLDEAANIAPLRDLDTLASTAAGHGIQLVSIFQDLAQISTRYGERAQTVVNNHRAKIVLSGISDTHSLEYASRLLGDEEVLQSSVTRGAQGRRSTTESVTLRSLAPAHVLRGIRPGEGILVYGHLPPARLHLRPWFKEKRLRAQAKRRR
jgi:type IV secretion system protein VirD4